MEADPDIDRDAVIPTFLTIAAAVKLGWIDMMLEDVDDYWRRVFTFSPFTVWFNVTGQPAIMLPVGQVDTAGAPRGLPLAVQLAARFGDEATLFRLSAQLEAARPWFDRKPALASCASRTSGTLGPARAEAPSALTRPG